MSTLFSKLRSVMRRWASPTGAIRALMAIGAIWVVGVVLMASQQPRLGVTVSLDALAREVPGFTATFPPRPMLPYAVWGPDGGQRLIDLPGRYALIEFRKSACERCVAAVREVSAQMSPSQITLGVVFAQQVDATLLKSDNFWVLADEGGVLNAYIPARDG